MVTALSFRAMRMSNVYSVRKRSGSRDDRGERLLAYEHAFYLWCEAPREGRTSVFGDGLALRSEDSVRFRARYTPNVEVGDQLVGDYGTLYVRQAFDIDGRGRFLQVVAAQTPAVGT